MPRLVLKLLGPYRERMPEEREVVFPAVETVGALLAKLEIPAEDPAVVLVNGVYCDHTARLSEGDRVVLFAPIAGG